VRIVAALAFAALVVAAPARASERQPTLAELEGRVMCPVCGTTLDQSSSPIAKRIESFISRRIRAGDTRSEIERKLVAQFGPSILAAPQKTGFGLLAWWLPLGGAIAAAAVLGVLGRRWVRAREPAEPEDPLDPDLERRVDLALHRYE
jgi:cytochrome c-type biogenesis protein CcmH/NrfF